MVAYVSSNISAGKQPRYLPKSITPQLGLFAATTAFLANDTINMVQLQADPSILPNGPAILGVKLDVPRLDTNGSPTLAMSVGDSGNASRFIAAGTVGGSAQGSVVSANVGGSTGYLPFAGSFGTYTTISNQIYTVVITVTAAAATFAAGTITLLVEATYDP